MFSEKAKIKHCKPTAENVFCLFTFYFSLVVGLLVLYTAGCDQTFEPLKENNQYHFSIYGFLDASADTQWVRVSPARGQLEMQAVKPEMEVTLEHLESGNTIVMHDSLFEPGGSPDFINFWTTADIERGQTYRLKAERPDGAESRVTITTPGEFPTPRLRKEARNFGEPDSFNLFIDEVQHLADVQTKWYVRLVTTGFESDKIFSFSHRNLAENIVGDRYRIPIEPEKELEQIKDQVLLSPSDEEMEVIHQQIYVASGGPSWDEEIASLDDLVYTLPDGFSNVEEGLGYMVGLNSKWIPFESCYNGHNQLIACDEEEPFW